MSQEAPFTAGVPDPINFEDPVQYLRKVHHVIQARLRVFEELITQADAIGVKRSFAEHDEWASLLLFFSKYLPVHEHDEEEHLFPWVLEKVPHTGFQPKESPMKFLLEGHEVLEERAKELVAIWKSFVLQESGATPPGEAAEAHFLQASRDLVKLLREHIVTEERLVYAKANDLLTPMERQLVMEGICRNHVAVVASAVPNFDTPTSSMPVGDFSVGTMAGADGYELTDVSEVAPSVLEPVPDEEEEESEPDEDGGGPNDSEGARGAAR